MTNFCAFCLHFVIVFLAIIDRYFVITGRCRDFWNIFMITDRAVFFSQYFVITLGEIMFSVTGLEFSYSQVNKIKRIVLK
jgi:hypothetical protein